jgi:predicted ATP-binding protein involved in virulence
MRRIITQLKIEGLFERFNYTINLDQNESKVVILTAPNGYGKSTILKIIKSFAAGDYYYFLRENFRTIVFSFSHGSDVSIIKMSSPSDGNQVLITYENKTAKISDPFSDSAATDPVFLFERALPFLTRIGPNTWRHDRSGERLSKTEVIARYGSHPAIRRKTNREEWLEEIRSSLNVFSIPTHRLRIEDDDRSERTDNSTDLMVHNIASRIKDSIAKAIRNQFDIGRKQETSFPTRLISSLRARVTPSQDSIFELITSIQRYERRYSRLGLLPDSTLTRQIADVPDVAESAALLVLKTYLDDVREKFQLLDDIASRLDVFCRSINHLIAFKQIQTSVSDGIEVFPKTQGPDKPPSIPLSALSSGEQHLIVLIGKLIFEADANTLVLLDEPEISFHPEWQEKFLSILEVVRRINNFSALIATHSSILIGDRWDQVIELAEQGGVDTAAEEFDDRDAEQFGFSFVGDRLA